METIPTYAHKKPMASAMLLVLLLTLAAPALAGPLPIGNVASVSSITIEYNLAPLEFILGSDLAGQTITRGSIADPVMSIQVDASGGYWYSWNGGPWINNIGNSPLSLPAGNVLYIADTDGGPAILTLAITGGIATITHTPPAPPPPSGRTTGGGTEPEAKPQTGPSGQAGVIVGKQSAPVYEQPDAKSKVIGSATPGESILLTKWSGDWCYILYANEGRAGWVRGAFVKGY